MQLNYIVYTTNYKVGVEMWGNLNMVLGLTKSRSDPKAFSFIWDFVRGSYSMVIDDAILTQIL